MERIHVAKKIVENAIDIMAEHEIKSFEELCKKADVNSTTFKRMRNQPDRVSIETMLSIEQQLSIFDRTGEANPNKYERISRKQLRIMLTNLKENIEFNMLILDEMIKKI